MKPQMKLTGIFLLAVLLGLALITGCGSSNNSQVWSTIGRLTFSGTVVDADDTPVSGVGVTLTSRSVAQFSLADTGTRAAFSTTTDKDGKFSFGGLTAGTYTLSALTTNGKILTQVDASGQVTQSVAGAEIKVIANEDQWNREINTDDAHPYDAGYGYVLAETDNAEGAPLDRVSLDTSTGGGYGSRGYYAEGGSAVDWSFTQTTGNGRGFFYAVAPGSHIVEAHREGYRFTNQSVTAAAGHISVIFMEGASTATYSVGGSLTETDGATPIAGAEAVLTSRSRNCFKTRQRYTVHTNAQGRFDFSSVPEGNYTLRFSKDNYVPFNMLLAVGSDMSDLGPVLVQESRWDTFMGDATHPYNAAYAYVMVQARRTTGTRTPISGAVIDSAQAYGSRGYAQDTDPLSISFSAASTGNSGLAFFYNTGVATHTFSATETDYTFQSLTGIVPIAGEIVYAPLYATSYPPQIDDITPDPVMVKDKVTVTGSGFGNSQGENTITFKAVDAGSAELWSETQIVCTVPSGIGGTVAVVVTANGKTGNAYDLVVSIMEFVTVPAGEFIMGRESGMGSADATRPPHTVYLDEYQIGKYEVTNAQFAEFVRDSGYVPEGNWDTAYVTGYPENYPDYPVLYVTWNDATAFCDYYGLHLPTEAQWEKAARGADERTYPWGDTWDFNKCNNSSNTYTVGMISIFGHRGTMPVGSFPDGASPYGAMDMAGNVTEWCSDWYQSDYYAVSPYSNPTGPDSGTYKVFRGGAWRYRLYDSYTYCCPYRVHYYTTSESYYYNGFRCAR